MCEIVWVSAYKKTLWFISNYIFRKVWKWKKNYLFFEYPRQNLLKTTTIKPVQNGLPWDLHKQLLLKGGHYSESDVRLGKARLGCHYSDVPPKIFIFIRIGRSSGWSLFAGSLCLVVVVNIGLTVQLKNGIISLLLCKQTSLIKSQRSDTILMSKLWMFSEHFLIIKNVL